jgi:hypothetical protein
MPHPCEHVPVGPAAPSSAAAAPTASLPARARARDQRGQATVELIALLPCLAALLAALWQLALLGYAEWAASAAARAAARAHAVGSDPGRAAREHVPGSLRGGLQVSAGADGDVSVALRVPRLPGVPNLGRVHAAAHFEPQS